MPPAESVSRMDRVQRLLDDHSKLQLASKFVAAEGKLAEYQRRAGELARENANLRARLRSTTDGCICRRETSDA